MIMMMMPLNDSMRERCVRRDFEIVQAKERSTDLEHQLVRKPRHHRRSVGNVSDHEQLHHALLEHAILG